MYTNNLNFFKQKKNQPIQFVMSNTPVDSDEIVKSLAAIQGNLDIYCWYEGNKSLPEPGAAFMTNKLFQPLYKEKKDITLCLYSLKAWSFTDMNQNSDLGKTIAQMGNKSIRWVNSSSFFQFCLQQNSGSLFDLIQILLSQKKWLFTLSEKRKLIGKTVGEFLGNQASLLDCIKNVDLSRAYSAMQYIEAYYLIRESVQNGINNGSKKIQIAFILPNDESKYYQDLADDIQSMLRADFNKGIEDCNIMIYFQFFIYGFKISCRPYIVSSSKEKIVTSENLNTYFTYLSESSRSEKEEVVLSARIGAGER